MRDPAARRATPRTVRPRGASSRVARVSPPSCAASRFAAAAASRRASSGHAKTLRTKRSRVARGAETKSSMTSPYSSMASLVRASPVDWSPMTTHLPSASAVLATSMTAGTLDATQRSLKKRWWAPQK